MVPKKSQKPHMPGDRSTLAVFCPDSAHRSFPACCFPNLQVHSGCHPFPSSLPLPLQCSASRARREREHLPIWSEAVQHQASGQLRPWRLPPRSALMMNIPQPPHSPGAGSRSAQRRAGQGRAEPKAASQTPCLWVQIQFLPP